MCRVSIYGTRIVTKLLRYQPPDSHEHMLTFFGFAYSMIGILRIVVPYLFVSCVLVSILCIVTAPRYPSNRRQCDETILTGVGDMKRGFRDRDVLCCFLSFLPSHPETLILDFIR